ncbi:alpha/beta fold hydrolase [Parvularcula maris]|uniref:Alpha/beta fold hydrolase n=1 Tax=Parvularcula maris TaxID=2965077 RepID=A0A9X2L6C5_9PROT|nr:alpha/beta fold hydrolase [Parvularcula maris]MCQ8183861.1 alpha/beta fold hydrolase [Parvularcula maris]
MRRVIIIVVLGLLALLTAGMAFLYEPDTDREEMIALYGGEQARWAPVEGHQDYRVHYRVSGPEDAPVLVLIHGTAASLHTWAPLRERLDQDYRVIAYDQPGHGLTGPHPERDYTFAGMREGLDAVLKATNTTEAVLIGNSMGGWVAWRMALDEPELVKGLVLIDPAGVPVEEESEGNIGFTIAQSSLGRALMKKITPRSLIESSVKQTVADENMVTPEMVDRYHDLLRFPGNREAAGDQFISPRQDLSGRLGEINAPTLILWGEEDRLIPVAAGRVFERDIPGAELIVYEGVGHLPMEEAPDRTAEDISGFLARLEKSAPSLAERLAGEWLLVSLDGEEPLRGDNGRIAGATFTEERVGGSAGCNGGGAAILSWTENGYATDGVFVATKMLCANLMPQEELLFAILNHGAVRFEGETLVMTGPNGTEARFERADE